MRSSGVLFGRPREPSFCVGIDSQLRNLSHDLAVLIGVGSELQGFEFELLNAPIDLVG